MGGYISVGVLLFMTLIEIIPVKINPLSWLGKHFNKEISNKIESIEKSTKESINSIRTELLDLRKTTDMMNIDAIRSRILDVDMIIRNGGHPSFDRYNSIFKDISKWKNYHEKYTELNGIINASIENINEAYKKEKFN